MTLPNEVIEAGNGFYWGNYAFDGTTVTIVYASSDDFGILNPFVFSTGRALYLTQRLVADYPGDTPRATTFTHTYNYSSERKAQMLLNGTKLAVPMLSSSTSDFGPGSHVDELYVIDADLTETAFPLVPGVESGAYIPFDVDGIVYSAKCKSTDLVNWTEVTGMPEGSRSLFPALSPVVFYCYTYSPYKLYVSPDNLASWHEVPSGQRTTGQLMFGDRCWSRYADGYSAAGGYVTVNAINRVIDHVLYLK
jgi:hypothetical protein